MWRWILSQFRASGGEKEEGGVSGCDVVFSTRPKDG